MHGVGVTPTLGRHVHKQSETMEIFDTLEFAVDHDEPIPYINRITSYYQRLGYGNSYQWARYEDVPFTPLSKPLAESQVALVTTAAPYQPGNDQGPGAPYNAAAKFYKVFSDTWPYDPDLRVSHIGIDRNHTTAEDQGTYFPRRSAGWRGPHRQGRTAFSRRTDQSPQRTTMTRTAPSFWHASAKTDLTSPSLSPTDRCATRP